MIHLLKSILIFLAFGFFMGIAHADENHNYWLFDWDRLVLPDQDINEYGHVQFDVSGQMLISGYDYKLVGEICIAGTKYCAPVTEWLYIENVGAGGKYALLGDGTGTNQYLVNLFKSGFDMVVTFGNDVRSFLHAGDFENRPELVYGDNGMYVKDAIYYLLNH